MEIAEIYVEIQAVEMAEMDQVKSEEQQPVDYNDEGLDPDDDVNEEDFPDEVPITYDIRELPYMPNICLPNDLNKKPLCVQRSI